MLVCAHLVEQTSQCPYIALLVVGLFLAQLRRQIKRRAYHRLCEVGVLMKQLGHTQIADFNDFVAREEYVKCFDVPMQNALAVNVLESIADLQEEPPDFVLLQGAITLLLEQESEITAFAVLHDDVQAVLIDKALQVAHDERTG